MLGGLISGAAEGGGGGDAGELSSEFVAVFRVDGDDVDEPAAQSTFTSTLLVTPATLAEIVAVPVLVAMNLVSNLPLLIVPFFGSMAPVVVYRLTLP